MIVLIDADPIVYRCGFAAEQTSWHLVYETFTGEVDEIEFSPTEDSSAGEQMRAWLAFNEGKITVLDKSRVIRPDPVSYALRATKVQIESIISECEAKFGPCKMLMWISAGKCYRDKIATVRPYKGNRDPTHKPYHYSAIRDYLCTQYSSFVARGIEADDAVSIYAHNLRATGGDSYVVATIDKDLDQIPGNHYNYMNKTFYAITEQESERWFVYQLLAGDITDNIVGVWKCGDKQATAILAGIPESAFNHAPVRGKHRHVPLRGHSAGHAGTGAGRGNDSDSAATDAGAVRGDDGDIGSAGVDSAERGNRGAGSDEQQSEPAPMGLSVRHGQPSESDRASGGSDRPGSDSGSSGASGCSGAPSKSVAKQWDAQHAHMAGRDNEAVRAEPTHQRPYATSPAWWPTVLRAYAASQRKSACPYAESDPEAVAIEMAQLVKLQEYPGQLWHPHGDLVVPGFGEENFDD